MTVGSRTCTFDADHELTGDPYPECLVWRWKRCTITEHDDGTITGEWWWQYERPNRLVPR